MALLASCFCCSLSICCGVLGLYLLVAYIIALTIELWWIAQAQDVLPIPAYLLSVGYLLLFLFSGALLYGLNTKKSTFLLVWMFLMGILLGPEAGMVLYMSIHHWRINTLNGLIEITFWACRLLVNATALLCVQSLYSTWRDEKSMMLRLQALKMSPVPGQARDRLGSMKIPQRHEYLNHGYQQDEPKQLVPTYEPPTILDNFFVAPIDSPCEFNASSFNTNVIDARILKQQELDKEHSSQRTQSLLDIPEEEYNNAESLKNMNNKSISLNYINQLGKPDDITQSLDRKMLKTKNMKILKKLSPFLGRKTTDEVNVYQIHPPKVIKTNSTFDQVDSGEANRTPTNLDRQLNQVYSSRGMYAYDENLRKLVYYPPEFFNHGEMRQLRRSTESSRSSMEDSEDIRSRIGDVAL